MVEELKNVTRGSKEQMEKLRARCAILQDNEMAAVEKAQKMDMDLKEVNGALEHTKEDLGKATQQCIGFADLRSKVTSIILLYR